MLLGYLSLDFWLLLHLSFYLSESWRCQVHTSLAFCPCCSFCLETLPASDAHVATEGQSLSFLKMLLGLPVFKYPLPLPAKTLPNGTHLTWWHIPAWSHHCSLLTCFLCLFPGGGVGTMSLLPITVAPVSGPCRAHSRHSVNTGWINKWNSPKTRKGSWDAQKKLSWESLYQAKQGKAWRGTDVGKSPGNVSYSEGGEEERI